MENHTSEINMRQLAKELRLTRVFCAVSSLLTLCLLIGGILFFCKLQPVVSFIQEAQPVMEQLSKLDVEAVNTALQGLDTEELSEAASNMNKAAETLESWGEKLSSFTDFFR